MEAGKDISPGVKDRHEVEVGLLPHGGELFDERRRVPADHVPGDAAVPGQEEGHCPCLVLLGGQNVFQPVNGQLRLLPGIVLEKPGKNHHGGSDTKHGNEDYQQGGASAELHHEGHSAALFLHRQTPLSKNKLKYSIAFLFDFFSGIMSKNGQNITYHRIKRHYQ